LQHSDFDAISPTQNIINRGVLIYKFSREIDFVYVSSFRPYRLLIWDSNAR